MAKLTASQVRLNLISYVRNDKFSLTNIDHWKKELLES